MANTLQQKNEFVLALREHLKEVYDTSQHDTFGEGDFEGKRVGDTYILARRDANEPRDITGFAFRKDGCSRLPRDIREILSEIRNFARSKGLKSKLDTGMNSLSLKVRSIAYDVYAFMGPLYADEINVWFTQSVIQ